MDTGKWPQTSLNQVARLIGGDVLDMISLLEQIKEASGGQYMAWI